MVWHEEGHAIAGDDTRRPERLREARGLGVKLGMVDPAPDPVLAPEYDRGAAVAAAEQVLREVEARLRKEAGARHRRRVQQDRPAAIGRADAGVIPDRGPEGFHVLDREAVEIRVFLRLDAETLLQHPHEGGEVGRCDSLGGRPPKRFGHCRLRLDKAGDRRAFSWYRGKAGGRKHGGPAFVKKQLNSAGELQFQMTPRCDMSRAPQAMARALARARVSKARWTVSLRASVPFPETFRERSGS